MAVTNEDLDRKLQEHIKHTEDRFLKGEKNFDKVNRVLFGDPETGEKGMSEKVTDIHTRIVQVDGIGSLFKWLILIGGALGAIKLWIIR